MPTAAETLNPKKMCSYRVSKARRTVKSMAARAVNVGTAGLDVLMWVDHACI